MEKVKIKISAVSYLNTIPFLHGIAQSDLKDEIELSLDMPSSCAEKLLDGHVDLGLVPIAILPQLKEHHIVSNFCIGADGKVASVALFSEVPLDEIETIYLDYQSKTSVNLVQILAEEHWKITPKWINASAGFEQKIAGTTAAVVIGDRTFSIDTAHKYDLAEAWKAYKGLPFVFACWVSNKELPADFVQRFDDALSKGVENLEEAVQTANNAVLNSDELLHYLSSNISYKLDESKRNAIQEFLSAIEMRSAQPSES